MSMPLDKIPKTQNSVENRKNNQDQDFFEKLIKTP
jgi:hypothetical protein